MLTSITRRYYIWALWLLAAALFSYAFIDRSLAEAVYYNPLPGWLQTFSWTCDHWADSSKVNKLVMLIGLFGLVFILRDNRFRARQCGFIVLAYTLAYVITGALKILLARSRPELLFIHDSYGMTWFSYKHIQNSMPSGHATVNAALALALLCLLRNRVLQGLLIAYAAGMAASRLVIDVHFLSDVLVGGAVALIAVGTVWEWWQRLENPNHNSAPG